MKGWRRNEHVKLHGRLTSPRRGAVLVTASIGPDGSAIALWAFPRDAAALQGRTENHGGASFADVVLQRPVEAHVTMQSPSQGTQTTIVNELRLAHPKAQPMPNGELLIVGARCAWTPTAVEPNAAVYTADGAVRRSAVVGDGVEHVRTTAAGDVWVGYFDEGIYGNYGWGGPGPTPVGCSGLVRFDQDLNIAWEFPLEAAAPPIDDCSALNVDVAAWVCYDSEYPLAHIEGSSVRTWPTEISSTSALLVDEDRVGFIGAHTTLARIEGNEVQVTGTMRLDLPHEASHPGTQFIGQGPVLHVLTSDGSWFVADLNTLLKAVG